jgi:hypothetical protein
MIHQLTNRKAIRRLLGKILHKVKIRRTWHDEQKAMLGSLIFMRMAPGTLMELSEVSKRSPQDKQRLDPLASTLGLSVSLDCADLGVLFLLCGMRKFERTTKQATHAYMRLSIPTRDRQNGVAACIEYAATAIYFFFKPFFFNF